MREAKDFINAKIAKGELTSAEITNPDSAYNRIKRMMDESNNPGYTGYFVRQHYKNPSIVTVEKLKVLLDYLIKMKKLNKPVDISKYSKTDYAEFLAELKSIVDVSKIGAELPGLVINEDEESQILAAKIKQYPWYVIVCVKKKGDKWEPDHDSLLNWGSPRWCIKRSNYWKDSYVKGKDHLQYVVIHEKFYEDVVNAAKQKERATVKLVPVNYGTNFDNADHYNAGAWKENSAKLRFGITTQPSESINTFFQQRDNLICFDDANSGVGDISRFSDFTGGLPIRMIDIEIRKILKMKRSEFDVSIPTFEEIIKFIEFKPTLKADDLIKLCGNFVQIMEKALSKGDDFITVQRQISPYFLKNMSEDPKNIFWSMMYAILYADVIDPKLMAILEDLFQIKNIEDKRLNMTVAISMLQIYMNMKDKKIKMDKNADTVIDKYMVKNFLLYHTLSSAIKDKPTSTIDFKRAMLQTFRAGKIYTDLEGVNHNVTRAKMFKLLANYLFIYDKEYGERIMRGELFKKGEVSWNNEIKYIEEISKKIKEKNTERTPFIDEVAINVLKRMPDALSDRIDGTRFDATMEDVFNQIETYEYNFTYKTVNHADCLFASLKYYVNNMNPAIKKELLGK